MRIERHHTAEEEVMAEVEAVEEGYGYGHDRGFGGPKPVETGKEYDVQITETSRQGDGIARVQGFVIFVKNGKVGQKVKIRITNVGERCATAEVVVV